MDLHDVVDRADHVRSHSALRHAAMMGVTLLLGAGVLAGCSSSPNKNANSTTTKPSAPPAGTATVPKGSIPKNTTTTLPKPGEATGAACQKDQLSVTQASSGLSGGNNVAVFAISNDSGTRCTLTGYPVLGVFGSLGPLTIHLTDGSVAGGPNLVQTVVSLAPHGGQASFGASWNSTSTTVACPAGMGAVITLPGIAAGFTLKDTFITACGGAVNVSPIQPNVVTL